MGLDSRFLFPDDEIPESLKDLNLCGGMFSGDGSDGSFRGKVYEGFLAAITEGNFSLYQFEQEPEDYKIAVDALREWVTRGRGAYTSLIDPYFNVSNQEVRDLQLLFSVAYKHNATLIGWW